MAIQRLLFVFALAACGVLACDGASIQTPEGGSDTVAPGEDIPGIDRIGGDVELDLEPPEDTTDTLDPADTLEPLPGTWCNPCVEDEECGDGGVGLAAGWGCMDTGAAGSFCLPACDVTAPSCPTGTHCVEPRAPGMAPWCQPDVGYCTCSDDAIAEGLFTSCAISNEFGACPGTRSCAAEGLTLCEGTAPAEELCDGEDQDCDGEIDEGFPDSDGDGIPDCLKPADSDGDGVPDLEDNCPYFPNADQGDMDTDGLGDVCDDDIDGDGYPNEADNCPLIAHSEQTDLDEDGQGDVCDDDDDGDLYPDVVDTCPGVANPDQSDLDGDGTGDACDGDMDGDGVPNGMDNCPLVPNLAQSDTDGDGVGDVCDVDSDQDGIPDGLDNCPWVPNPEQGDLDLDGLGDACDLDVDGDGVPDYADLCPLIPNPDQSDLDEDFVGDACDDDDDNDGLDDWDDNCPTVPNP